VGTTHTVTAQLLYDNSTVVADDLLNFSIVSGPHAGLSEDVLTDECGYAVFSYNGSVEGEDCILITYENTSKGEYTTKYVREIVGDKPCP